MRKSFLRKTAIALAAVAAFSGIASAKTVTLNIWFPLYGGNLKIGFDEIVKQFEKKNPGIKIQVLGVDVSGEKFLTAMAGGAPPDVIFPDGPQVVQWAFKNLLTPLDKYIKSSKLNTDSFWAPSYKQNVWQGKPYALPWITDSNFALVYNKSVFNEAGIAKAPESLTELDAYVKKINKVDPVTGIYTRFGFQPYGADGADFNAMYNFGWAFGADYFDEKNQKVNLNTPKMVSALEWMNNYTQRYEYNKMQKFWEKYTNWGMPAGVLTGRLGMAYHHSAILNDMVKAKKTYTDFGYGFVVGPNGGKTAWLGGWTAAIPANAKHRDEAWKFVKWVCYEPAGSMATYNSTGFLPSVKTAECYTNPEPKLKPFVEVLKIANFYRPVTPVMPIMNAELNRVMPLVFTGKKVPKQALDEVTTNSQKELDRILAKRKR